MGIELKPPERLTRWMNGPNKGAYLRLDHPVQDDLAWAADEIARLRRFAEWMDKHRAEPYLGPVGNALLDVALALHGSEKPPKPPPTEPTVILVVAPTWRLI